MQHNPFAFFLRADGGTYWDWAGRIAHPEATENAPFFSAPLYPYLLGLLRYCGGGLVSVYALQVLLGLATAVLIAYVARRRFGAPVGLLSAALFLLMFEPASESLRVLPTTLQLPLICVAWLALLRAQQRPGAGWALLSGAALGLFALTYPPAILCLPAFALWYCVQTRTRANCARAVLLLLAGLVVIAPATTHNFRACREFIPISAQAGVTFAQGNAPESRGIYTPLPGISADRNLQNLDARRVCEQALGRTPTWGETDRFFLRRGLEFWRAAPLRALALVSHKAYWFLTARRFSEVTLPALELEHGLLTRLRWTPLQTAWLIPLALVAVALWLRRPLLYAPELLLFALPLLVVLLFFYSPRYRFPAVPVIVVGAAWVLCTAWTRRRSAWILVPGGAIVLAAALTFANDAVGFDSVAPARAEFAWDLGTARARAGNLPAAAECFAQAVELKPDLQKAELDLADVLRRLGRLPESAKHAERVLQRNPDSADAHNVLGLTLAMQRQIPAAAEHFRRAIALAPAFVDAHGNLGNALTELGDTTAAIAEYQTAVQLNSSYIGGWYGLAVAHLRRNELSAAREALDRALAIDPQFKPAATLRESLQPPRAAPR